MLTELVLSANKGGPAMYAWDLRTGTVRTSFKQCDVGHHSVAAAGSRDGPNLSPSLFLALKSDCLSISAYSWSKELPMLTFRCPEKLACIAASPDGVFCAAGAYNSGNVYVWEIATGTMLACFQAHRGTVTVIRFSNDGTLLITGGHDALVQSWIVSNVVAIESLALDSRTAHTTMADHSLPITDIQVGGGTAASGRIVSTGRDGRCNVWDLATGELVVTFVLPCPVWSAVIDPSERFVYMGCDDGLIRMASLYKRNATTGDISSVGETTATVGSNVIAVSSASSETAFIGHSQAVRSLSLSFDATLLVSGSDDGSVNVWDTVSRKALRTFTGHKGAQITHVDIIISPAAFEPWSSAPDSTSTSAGIAMAGVGAAAGAGGAGGGGNAQHGAAPMMSHALARLHGTGSSDEAVRAILGGTAANVPPLVSMFSLKRKQRLDPNEPQGTDRIHHDGSLMYLAASDNLDFQSLGSSSSALLGVSSVGSSSVADDTMQVEAARAELESLKSEIGQLRSLQSSVYNSLVDATLASI